MVFKPVISVVIPVFNKEKYVLESVQSVLAQTFRNFELIVVDDGSTDCSVQVLLALNDDRLKIINQENQGVSVARNTGILNSTTGWIAFLDADDWWDERFLEEVMAGIQQHPKHTVFATGRSRVFLHNIERYKNGLLPKDGETGLVDYFDVIGKFFPPINSSNVVLNKSLLLNAGLFKPNQKQYEDHDLWLRVCKEEKVVFINKNLSFYRKIDKDSASNNYYTAGDFLKYLDTIAAVKKDVNGKKRTAFAKYYNKFILIIFIRNYKRYSRGELVEVFKKAAGIVDKPFLIALYLVKVFPDGRAYEFVNFFYKR